MKILFTVDESGFEEYIGPFSGQNEADEWARKNLSASTSYEVLDLTVPREAHIPGSMSIDIESFNKLDLTPLLEKE